MSSAVETKEKKVTTITLKPVIRAGWLPKGHDGEYKFTGCETWETPPKNTRTGQRLTGLTEADEQRLEKKLRLSPGTLNKYNEDFWSKFYVKIPKEGRTFYMDNPRDELEVLTLKTNPRIANSQMEVADSPGASFYLTSVEEESAVENAAANIERQAIKRYGQLSTQKMIDVLRVYNLLSGGKEPFKVNKSTPVDVVENNLYKKLKTDPEEFIRIVDDPNFGTKVLIDKLVENRILLKSGVKYVVHGGDVIGSTLEHTIDYLENPHNQGVLIALKDKLSAMED